RRGVQERRGNRLVPARIDHHRLRPRRLLAARGRAGERDDSRRTTVDASAVNAIRASPCAALCASYAVEESGTAARSCSCVNDPGPTKRTISNCPLKCSTTAVQLSTQSPQLM